MTPTKPPELVPPYIAVIFTSRRNDTDHEEYGRVARHMESLAAAMPGYLGIESVRGEDGVGITISYWREPFHAQAWKEVAEHQAAQVAGRERFYEWYRVRVATVLREHGFERDVPERTGEP